MNEMLSPAIRPCLVQELTGKQTSRPRPRGLGLPGRRGQALNLGGEGGHAEHRSQEIQRLSGRMKENDLPTFVGCVGGMTEPKPQNFCQSCVFPPHRTLTLDCRL